MRSDPAPATRLVAARASLRRIGGVMLQQGYIVRRELAIWVDLGVFSIVSVLVFGFLSRYLANGSVGGVVVVGMLLWEVLRMNQYAVSVNSMWQIWAHNLTNVFIAPVSTFEYIVAHCLLALGKCFAVAAVMWAVSALAFHVTILDLGAATMLWSLVLMVVLGWGLGWLFLGFVFRYGTSVQAVTWGTIVLLQPLCAVYYPVSVIPTWLRWASWSLPPTYVFEAARHALGHGGAVDVRLLSWGSLLTVVWFVACLLGFLWLFARSREVAQFARNDS